MFFNVNDPKGSNGRLSTVDAVERDQQRVAAGLHHLAAKLMNRRINYR
jgi:hypothetical protein